MTATERLRALLDERGVEWTGSDVRTSFLGWEAYEYYVFGQESGLVAITTALTPEQAVEATLGRGECRDVCDCDLSAFKCSECGWYCDTMHDVAYCGGCGRKVVDA